jgi:hypothetical protein
MFWLCVSGAAFAGLRSLLPFRPSPSSQPTMFYQYLFLMLLFISFWSPFVAVGALMNNTKRAMIYGAIAVPILYLVFIVATLLTVRP